MNAYRTCDLGLAAFLRARGCRLLETSRIGSRFFFVFEDNGGVDNLVSDFFNDGSVGVQQFLQSSKMLLGIIKSRIPDKGDK